MRVGAESNTNIRLFRAAVFAHLDTEGSGTLRPGGSARLSRIVNLLIARKAEHVNPPSLN